MRIDPPISEPVPMAEVPAANEAAVPPDEPPGVMSGFHGLRVTPQRRDHVKPAQENSGVAVRAWTMPPASRMRWLTVLVWSGMKSFISSEPFEVGWPAMKLSSLMQMGRPSSGPCGAPLA